MSSLKKCWKIFSQGENSKKTKQEAQLNYKQKKEVREREKSETEIGKKIVQRNLCQIVLKVNAVQHPFRRLSKDTETILQLNDLIGWAHSDKPNKLWEQILVNRAVKSLNAQAIIHTLISTLSHIYKYTKQLSQALESSDNWCVEWEFNFFSRNTSEF